jgi:hypothetical protein
MRWLPDDLRETLFREEDFAEPTRIGILWTLEKEGQTLTCELYSHPVKAWAIQLTRDGRVLRTEACWTKEQTLKYADRWQLRAMQQGWQPPT